MKKTDGFTLVELVVGILATTLVSGAIMTFLLMGLKANRATIDANTDQRNAKIVISLLERLASDGTVSKLKINGELAPNEDGVLIDRGLRSWYLYGSSDSDILLSYSPIEKRLYTHDTVLLDGVESSSLTLSAAPLGGYLIGLTLQTKDSLYQTSVYNRLSTLSIDGIFLDKNNSAIIDSSQEGPHFEILEGNTTGRTAFLETLLSQYGSNGTIISNGAPTNVLYSLWYYNTKPNLTGTWGPSTPWCAIFVSWAIAQISGDLKTVPCEANVDSLWSQFAGGQTINPESAIGNVLPGDLIFFDWDGDSTHETPDLEHVGVVLFLDSTTREVYTIEGNSGSQVALRRYSIDDEDIFSYTKLAWK